jgi:hypothetical protein
MRLEPPLRNDHETTACALCGTTFQPVGRQRFCTPAHRQAAWRRRHPTWLPTVPAHTPRQTTVYQCPACESRYLGEQYCSECGRFCRRVGAGGLCPACEEPIAVTDLLPEYAESSHHPWGTGGRAPSPPNPLTPGAFGTPNSHNRR